MNVNQHWASFYESCSACHYNYAYIVHIETFDEDMKYLAKILSLNQLKTPVHKNMKSTDKDRLEFFENLDPLLLKKLLDIYKHDFYLFGYDISPYMEKHQRK